MRGVLAVLVALTIASPAMADLGDVVCGPFDVATDPNDIYCVGVAQGWNAYWVSAGDQATGTARIHKYDMNGNYIASYNQHTSGDWANRDLATDEADNKLWGGETGMLVEYGYNPGDGSLSYRRHYAMNPGGVGTIRALARNPYTGHFYTASWDTDIYEFDTSGQVYNTFTNTHLTGIYGMAWNPATDMLWIWSQDERADLLLASELDPSTGLFTGRLFTGIDTNPTYDEFAGGCDIYYDARSPTGLALVGLHQSDPDMIVGYEMDAGVCVGDVDGDGDTDLSDLGALLAAYGTTPGHPRWNPNADFNGDGVVGLADLGVLLADYGCGT